MREVLSQPQVKKTKFAAPFAQREVADSETSASTATWLIPKLRLLRRSVMAFATRFVIKANASLVMSVASSTELMMRALLMDREFPGDVFVNQRRAMRKGMKPAVLSPKMAHAVMVINVVTRIPKSPALILCRKQSK